MNDLKPSNRLKFRAWDEDNEVMYYSDKEYEDCFFGFDKGVVVAWLRKIVPQTLDEATHEVGEPIKAWQFTGLQGKNGKEIYEGDVVKMIGEDVEVSGEVVWDVDGFIVKFGKYVEVEPCLQGNFAHLGNKDWEVIGNIYESPNLLEETK